MASTEEIRSGLAEIGNEIAGIPTDDIQLEKSFTDDLDVNNRLYFGLLDAEGRRDDGNPDLRRHPLGGLARLRQPLPVPARERHGQNWGMAERIGHDFDHVAVDFGRNRDVGLFRFGLDHGDALFDQLERKLS